MNLVVHIFLYGCNRVVRLRHERTLEFRVCPCSSFLHLEIGDHHYQVPPLQFIILLLMVGSMLCSNIHNG